MLVIGQKLERHFGCAQDIEWAYAKGEFYIVQSRDITAFSNTAGGDAILQREWSRVLDCATEASPDDIAFEQNELSEVLPRPSLLSLSFMESVWASGGSVDLACRQLGLDYPVEENLPPYLVTIFGRLYVNKHQEASRAPKLSYLAAWRLNRISSKIKSHFHDEFLPTYLQEVTLQEALDFDKLSDNALIDLVKRICSNYLTSTYVEVSIINIAADYYLKRATKELITAGLEPAKYLVRSEQTEFERAVAQANAMPPNAVAKPRLGVSVIAQPWIMSWQNQAIERADTEWLKNLPILPTKTASEIRAALMSSTGNMTLIEAVMAACSFQTLKEDAKHYSLRELAVLRRAILAGIDASGWRAQFFG